MNSKIEELMKIFPECVTESRDSHGNLKHSIDFDILRQILGDQISDEPESYRFNWVGKNSARIEAYRKIDKTLRPDLESSLNFESTENLYIEGDNLDVLKLLQQSYFKKIKLIYIDPPYNTGHDFIYKDRFEMDEDEYADRVDLYDENGNLNFVENSNSNPRFHSDWCSMIYSRLLLARNLLSDDGVIFISIDDNEQSNLKNICDEVFGERNFVANLIWKKKYTGGKGSKTFVDYHEYILCYAKRIDSLGEIKMARPDNEKEKFTQEDEYLEERGRYYTRPLKSNLDPRPTLVYPIELPNGKSVTTQWICARETYEKLLQEGRIEFKDSSSSRYPVYKKFYENDDGGNVKIPSFLEISSNNEAKEELKKLFQITQTRDLPFPTPKPIKLISTFVKNFTSNEDIIMDFFAGSSSTAHSVMQCNSEDHGSRKFIMVQLPEICPENSEAFKAGFKNICEIGKERIRRAGSNFQNIDRGFRVLKLDSTNFRDVKISPEELTREKLFDLVENIKSDRSSLDLLFECLIDWGIELNLKLEFEEFEEFQILNYNLGDLIACFDKNISRDVIEFIARKNPNRVVFRDESFSKDSDRINAVETIKLHSPNTRFKVI